MASIEIWASCSDVKLSCVPTRIGDRGLQDLGVLTYARLVLVGHNGYLQLQRNIEALERRIAEIPDEISNETDAIRARYADPSPRLFPAVVEFLVPPAGLP